MLNFVEPALTEIEHRIVLSTLDRTLSDLSERGTHEFVVLLKEWDLTLFAPFGLGKFTEFIHSIREMLIDKSLVYIINDFHYFTLYNLLGIYIQEHNEFTLLGDEGTARQLISSVRPINFKELIDMLFWDTDFLIAKEDYNSMSVFEREAQKIHPEIFSIINGFTPHPDELKVKTKKPERRSNTNKRNRI